MNGEAVKLRRRPATEEHVQLRAMACAHEVLDPGKCELPVLSHSIKTNEHAVLHQGKCEQEVLHLQSTILTYEPGLPPHPI